MEFSITPMIKVYSRGSSSTATGSNHRTRILAQLNGSDEEEEVDRGKANQAAIRLEGDLNWASKYLQSDRSSSIPRSTENLKAYSTGPGVRSNGLHVEESTTFGGRNRRSISPIKFRDDRDALNGSFLRSTRSSTSPLSSRRDYSSRSGHVFVNSGRPPSGPIAPNISHPTTRTYNDLDRALPKPGNLQCSVAAGDHRMNKTPISGTRKKLRSVLCRSRNDPHYFDED